MSDIQIMTLLAIGAYFAIMIAIGLWTSRNQTYQGFIIGNRDVGYIPTMGSLSTSFRDGVGVIFWFGFGAATGYGGLWLFIGLLTGMMVYVFIGPSVRKTAKENGYITIGEMLRARYGVITERATASIVIVFSLMLIAIQLHVSGYLFSTILDVEAWVGISCVSIVVGFYLFLGGYSTVIKTDTVQFFLIIALIASPIFFAPPKEAILNFSSITSLGARSSIALALMGFFFVLSGAETWQRVFSARNDKVIKRSFPAAGLLLIIMTLSLIFLGMASAPFMGEAISTDNAFYEIFKGDFLPPALQVFIAVVVMAICMSTLDTFCYLVASTLGRNFLPKHIADEKKNYIRFTQIIIIFILVGMSILALTISDVIVFFFDAASLLFILAPVYVYAAFGLPHIKNRKTDALVASMVAISCIIYLYMFTHNVFDDLLMVSAPAGCSIILTSVAIYFGQRNSNAPQT